MQTSKNEILKTVIFCIVFIAAVCLVNFLLVPYSSLMKKFENYHRVQAKGNIGFAVIGSSLEGDGLLQEVIAEELGGNAVVFTPQGTNPEVEYLLLLDLLSKNKIDTFVIGWDLFQNLMSPYYKYPRAEQLNRELIKECWNSKELTRIMLRRYADQRYSQTFFQFCSFQDNIKNIPAVLKSKKERREKPDRLILVSDGEPIDVSNIHKDSFNYDKLLSDTYTDIVNPDDFNYVIKIRDVCKQNKINLFVLCAPAPQVSIDAIPLYHSMHKNSKQAFENAGISFIDTLDEKYFPGSTINTNFKDCYGHITKTYRETYTRAVCDYIKRFSNFPTPDKPRLQQE